MAITFDFEKMARLLANFYDISGVRYSLADVDNNLLCSSNDFADFCNVMNGNPRGHARCKQCDRDAMQKITGGTGDYLTYRCHAGLLETVIPIRGRDGIIAFIMFGQMVDEREVDAQWRTTRAQIAWMDDADAMRPAFYRLERTNENTIRACAEILIACSSYLWMEGVIKSSPFSDPQRLAEYIDSHYAENPTLDETARALSVSKSKLCGVAAKMGTTVRAMLVERQMEEAKRLLMEDGRPVYEVAAMVGVRDYNYFTKLFKARCGATPTEFRKAHGR